MINTCYSIEGYTYLYQSMRRYTELGSTNAKRLIYMLSTANQDSSSGGPPQGFCHDSDPESFFSQLDSLVRPYRTEVQFYKSILALYNNIYEYSISPAQHRARHRLFRMMSALELDFFRAYGFEIDDERTVFNLCRYHLVPEANEPSECLKEY